MGCQSEVYLEHNLTFSICTHDPGTGVLTDADAPPAYRVYEDETATAILTGSMALLDSANTTGFYTELIACTTANGFELNKSYSIYIEAAVDGDTGGISFGFKVKSVIEAAGIADAVWDEAIAGHLGAGSTGAKLNTASTAAGAGSIEWTYTVTDSDTGALLDGVSVWVTSDSAGLTVVASGTTNDTGVVTFYLDAGDYYIWCSKAGYNFSNPDTETVS